MKHFSLGTSENNKLVKVMRILFGIVCIAVALFWVVFNMNSVRTNGTIWISIIFLAGFGFYQIWSGLGMANMYIEIGSDYICFKNNPMLPVVRMKAGDIDKIELFPLNVIFFFRTGKKKLLRFGTTYHETNREIKDEILIFAELNKIVLEIVHEEL